jgi:hypothetical protein
MEADSGGRFQYGGRFRGQISLWRQIPGADFNMEAGSGGRFQYGGGFILHGGSFVSLVKTKPVILFRRSSTRGVLHKSIQLGGSYLCHVFRPAQRKLSSLMLFFYGVKFTYDST